jgi:sugar O-acyltransferase (sialic acid O-acetyltransferase NeuD family)
MPQSSHLIIIGAGGQGRVVLDILRAAGQPAPLGFVDADPALAGTSVDGVPVLGHPNQLPRLNAAACIVAIGDNRARQSYARMVLEHRLELASAIHPAATVSPAARIGRNIVIAAGAVAGTGASLADSVIINTNAVVEHDCTIGEAVHICPGTVLGGRVQVDEGAFIGLGARVIPCMRIGARAIVGAGAVVIADIPAGATAVGVPARLIRTAPV